MTGLTTGYRKGRPILRDVSFQVGPGEIVAVVGPNGSGKTTLFRALLGFLSPWSGEVLVGGQAPRDHRRVHGMGYLPETIAFPPGWSGMALLREGVRLSRVDGSPARDELAGAIRRTGLSAEELARSVDTLSKGMARRVAVAMILAGAPSPVLLDEPLTGLDAPSRVRMREEILQAAECGAAVLMASHDLDEVQRVAGRVVLLRDGVVDQVLEGRGVVAAARLEEMVLGTPLPPDPASPLEEST